MNKYNSATMKYQVMWPDKKVSRAELLSKSIDRGDVPYAVSKESLFEKVSIIATLKDV